MYASGVALTATLLGSVLAGCEAALPAAAHGAESLAALHRALPAPALGDVAQDTPIWENIVRYAQYFFSVMLGTGYVMLKPFAGLLKRPVTGVLLVAAVVGTVLLVRRTVGAMLGTDDLFEYDPIATVAPNAPLER